MSQERERLVAVPRFRNVEPAGGERRSERFPQSGLIVYDQQLTFPVPHWKPQSVANGRVSRKPTAPARLSTKARSPPWASAILRATYRPRPEPGAVRRATVPL